MIQTLSTSRRGSLARGRPFRFAAILACVGFAVASCGTNGGSSAPSGSAAQAPAGSAAASVSGTLTVWAMGNEGVKLKDLAATFMAANPGVTVNVTPVDWGQAVSKLQTAIAGHQTPDVSQMGTDMMGQFAATGALEPVPADILPATYFESAWNTNIVNGTVYGVPWYVETRLLYYRTDVAEKAGITAPPATWDDLTAMAKAMQSTGGAKYGISLGTKNWQEYVPFLWSNGGSIMDAQGAFQLNSPQAVEALTYYDSFFKAGLSPKSVPEGFDITPAFVAGTHPMFFSGPWHLGLIRDAGGAAFDGKWAIAPMPEEGQLDLVRRRQQPRRLQGQQEQGPGLGVRQVPQPTPRRRSPGTPMSPTCRPSRPRGTIPRSRATRTSPCSASSSRARRPSRPSRPGARWRTVSIRRSRR